MSDNDVIYAPGTMIVCRVAVLAESSHKYFLSAPWGTKFEKKMFTIIAWAGLDNIYNKQKYETLQGMLVLKNSDIIRLIKNSHCQDL